MKKRLDKRVASLEGNNLAVQWNLSNPTPEFSDKNLWSQSISVNYYKYTVIEENID